MGEHEEPKEYEVWCLCGTRMKLLSSTYGIFYGCPRYPECDVTVSAHQATGEPMGKPADKATRTARVKAHNAFDQLWKGGPVNWKRTECYNWLQRVMGLSEADAHIGNFTAEQCEKLVRLVMVEFETRGLVLLDRPPPKPEDPGGP